jgi:hypothetical protein
MTKDEALEIATKHGRTSQVAFFIIFLGIPPKEALIKAGIDL